MKDLINDGFLISDSKRMFTLLLDKPRSTTYLAYIIIGFATLFCSLPMEAQITSAKSQGHTVTQQPDFNTSVVQAMSWRLIGPFRGGRVVAVAGHPTNKLVSYMGATGGGVWKTEDGGGSWQNISDGFFKTGSVGAIAVSDSNPEVIYVGMGEHTLRGNTINGDGVYKSTDGGKAWTHLGLEDTYHIGSVIIHPTNPDIVYVAAIGHAFGPNKERGYTAQKMAVKHGKKYFTKIKMLE